MDARPLLDLQLRLGEATGALTAFPIVELACALHCDMWTFDDLDHALALRGSPPGYAEEVSKD